jgi:hypothetical protein
MSQREVLFEGERGDREDDVVYIPIPSHSIVVLLRLFFRPVVHRETYMCHPHAPSSSFPNRRPEKNDDIHRQLGWCGDAPYHCQSIRPTPHPMTPIPTYYPTYAPITDAPTGSVMPTFDYDDPDSWNRGTYAFASDIGERLVIDMPPATRVGDTLFLFVR